MLSLYGITRVADLTGLDRIGLPVAAAIRPLSRSIVVTAGKGVSLVAAKVSAAMEAIECAHAETIDRPLTFASRAELGSRTTTPALDSLPQLRGTTLTDNARFLWIEGSSVAGQPMMVPYELVHAHYCPYGLPGSNQFHATTNGLSSGNSFAEAVSHGLFEVIERDALALWSRRPGSERQQR
jgi:YcaO-like protein with predicted kinase domain